MSIDKTKNISNHITYKEAVYSRDALRYNIDNTPNEQQLANMQYVANGIFEPARIHFGIRMYISSFFRILTLNKKIGSTAKHGHPDGTCIDVDCDVYEGITNKQLFCYIYKNLNFTELIYEHPKDEKDLTKGCEWVHFQLVKGREKEKEVGIVTSKGWRLLTKQEINLILNS